MEVQQWRGAVVSVGNAIDHGLRGEDKLLSILRSTLVDRGHGILDKSPVGVIQIAWRPRDESQLYQGEDSE